MKCPKCKCEIFIDVEHQGKMIKVCNWCGYNDSQIHGSAQNTKNLGKIDVSNVNKGAQE